MKLRRIINGEKTVTDWGHWKRAGEKMPKTAYPLTRNAFKLPSKFNWRIVRFKCLGAKFRLLIAYRIDINSYLCYLGRELGTDTLTLARYEYHASEPGWHMHCNCDDADKAPGRLECSDKRLPHWESFHRNCEFGIESDLQAFNLAVKVFRLGKTPPFMLEVQ